MLSSPILPWGGVSRGLENSSLLSDYYISSAVLLCVFSMGQIKNNSVYLEPE